MYCSDYEDPPNGIPVKKTIVFQDAPLYYSAFYS